MVRISGIEIPANKKITVALTYVYGIGKKNVYDILRQAEIDFDKRANQLTAQEIARLQKVIDTIPVEGILRKKVLEDIKRLKQINCYRGLRHAANLPVRGQRTRSNARTKRGKRVTIGALRKEVLAKLEKAQKEKEKKQ